MEVEEDYCPGSFNFRRSFKSEAVFTGLSDYILHNSLASP